MKNVVGMHRDYGVLVNDCVKEDDRRYITIDDGLREREIQYGGYSKLTEQDVISRLKSEVNLIISRARFFGLTADQVQSIFPSKKYSPEVRRIAMEYQDARRNIPIEEFAAMTPKERMAQSLKHQTPLLELIGDTWSNRFNFESIVNDILANSGDE